MRAAIEETFTIRPQRVRIIGSSSGWVALKKPLTDTSITRCHCAALIPGSTASSCTPALLIRIWTGPSENLLERRARRGAVGDIEAHGFAAAAGGPDFVHQSRRDLG